MDALQLVFSLVNAPLFATFLLGMFWKRTTGHGAFHRPLSGTAGASPPRPHPPRRRRPGIHGGWIAVVHTYPSDMAQNFWTAIFAFSVNMSSPSSSRSRPTRAPSPNSSAWSTRSRPSPNA
jgi:SSS family solute:Na+ symporter